MPKGKNSALYLYLIYGALTFITIVLLFTGGMPLFDSVCHGMGIAGTGGFGIKNDGLSYYNSPYLDGVVTVTMLLFGVNFTLYYYMLIRRFREVRKNTELRVYFSIVAISTALIMLNIRPIYHSVGKCFRYAVFQVASIITSTGFATADYNQWPLFSQMLLILLMLIGACGGSTGGGFKVQRCVILWKSGSAAMRKMVHPNSVNQVKSDDKILRPEALHHVWSYLILYLGVLLASFLLLSLDDMDFGTAISAVITCTNNIGPGINSVGPWRISRSCRTFPRRCCPRTCCWDGWRSSPFWYCWLRRCGERVLTKENHEAKNLLKGEMSRSDRGVFTLHFTT